jgi:hypothetical protein
MNSLLFTIVSILAITQAGLACPDEKNCRMCKVVSSLGGKECYKCEASFLDAQTGKCNTNIPDPLEHCSTYFQSIDSKRILCSECNFGFMLNQDYECERCQTENCGLCETPSICSSCLDGYLPDHNGKCSQKKRCPDPNCEMCDGDEDSDNECGICKLGFVLAYENNECLPDKGLENCWIASEKGLCYECRFGYYITSDNRCLSNDSKDAQDFSRSLAKDDKHKSQTDLKVVSL